MKTLSNLLAIVLFFSVLSSCKKDRDGLASEKTKNSDTIDRGWPRIVERNGGKLVYYQPQLEEWKDFSLLKGKIAFSLTKDERQILGIASVEAKTLVDKDARQVYLEEIQIKDLRFPGVKPESIPKIKSTVQELFPKSGNPISIDRLMADLQQDRMHAEPVDVNNDPPRIFYTTKPAILLMVMGDPVLAPVGKTNLQYVVNANWDVIFDKQRKKYYLLIDKLWLTSTTLDGTWTKTTLLPDDMKKLPSGQGFDEVKKAVPAPAVKAPAPMVFFSNMPAELLITDGDPLFMQIEGTSLSYLDNTTNDVLRDNRTNTNYLLLSGRWFAARNLQGPWAYAGNSLPEDFVKIPEDSAMGHVLSAVPGTQQASDAVMLAQIPTTAIVKKDEVERKVKIHYDGDPQFKPIESTNLEYAVNTQDKVIKKGDLYYLCFQGVWFVSATAQGPWKTASSVPEEIYTIPPSSPVYNVTYVTQTEIDDEKVESETTAGYFGMFVVGMTFGAVLSYGTGYYYPPYMYYPPYYHYPVYRPWPMTYGAGAVYNPWTGGYAAGRRVYGPYGAAGTSAWYNPSTGRYGRSASVQGWYGGRTVASSYNPWTGAYGATRQGHNPYGHWGSSVASRGDDWIRTGHISGDNGSAFGYRTSGGKEGVITRGPRGNTSIHTDNGVYAGRDGNIYHKDNNGNWNKYNNGNWEGVDHHKGTGVATRDQNAKTARNRTAARNHDRATEGKADQRISKTADRNASVRTSDRKMPERNARQLGGQTNRMPERTVGTNPGVENRQVSDGIGGGNLGTASRQAPDHTASQSLGGQNSRSERSASHSLGGPGYDNRGANHNDVMRNLENDDRARLRGEQQTQRHNNYERNQRSSGNYGGNHGGGSYRSGGGARGGGGGFRGRH